MKGRRRSLTNVGGPVEARGEPGAAAALAECLSVGPPERLPFTHGFHAYPARMHPEIARRAIRAFGPGGGGRVFDPFVGSGTTAVEALRAGLPFTGLDISRVPLAVAWVRTRVLAPGACRRVEIEGARIANRARGGLDPELALPGWAREERNWYAPHTLREIVLLADQIGRVEEDALRRILRAVLSSLLVKLSRQESDSVAVPSRDVRPLPRGHAFDLFRAKCAELARNLLALSRDLGRRRIRPVEPELVLADAREFALPAASVGLILSSPPYPGTYDYALHHARRSPLFGEEPADVAGREIGSRSGLSGNERGLARYRDDLAACLANALGALAPGGRAVLLLGDGQAGGKAILADRLVRDLARRLGARLVATASQERLERSRRRCVQRKREHLFLLEPARAAT
ncbi:MAG: hypothetical protein HY720_32440 [Planctomycetes bacterium]|nr:hypothetical protein [Planctomycetota bacterium]